MITRMKSQQRTDTALRQVENSSDLMGQIFKCCFGDDAGADLGSASLVSTRWHMALLSRNNDTIVWQPLCLRRHPILAQVKAQPCFGDLTWRALLKQQCISDKKATAKSVQPLRSDFMLGVEVELVADGRAVKQQMLSSLVELSAADALSPADVQKVTALEALAVEPLEEALRWQRREARKQIISEAHKRRWYTYSNDTGGQCPSGHPCLAGGRWGSEDDEDPSEADKAEAAQRAAAAFEKRRAAKEQQMSDESLEPQDRRTRQQRLFSQQKADQITKKPNRVLARITEEQGKLSLPLLNQSREDGKTGWDIELSDAGGEDEWPEHHEAFTFSTTVFLMRKSDGKRITLGAHCNDTPEAEELWGGEADWESGQCSTDGHSYEWILLATGGFGAFKNLVAQLGVSIHHEVVWQSEDLAEDQGDREVQIEVTGVDVFLIPEMDERYESEFGGTVRIRILFIRMYVQLYVWC